MPDPTGVSYLNADQQGYVARLAALPPDQKCPCGWYAITDAWRQRCLRPGCVAALPAPATGLGEGSGCAKGVPTSSTNSAGCPMGRGTNENPPCNTGKGRIY